MIIVIDIIDREVLLNLGDSINVNHLNNLQARKKLTSLDSCSHGGIYSTKNYLKVKIDFSSNVNPLGISRQVLKEITSATLSLLHQVTETSTSRNAI